MAISYLDPYDAGSPPHVHGAKGGSIEPTLDEAQWSTGQRLLAAWHRQHAIDDLVPPHAPIDALGPLLGSVHKLAVESDGLDFRYLIYGHHISRRANMGMQGKRVSELVEPARTIFLEHYRDLVVHPRLFVGDLIYDGSNIRHRVWARAVSPIGTKNTGVTGFIVFTMAKDVPGGV